jgi:methionyl-tRNA formyltransferase
VARRLTCNAFKTFAELDTKTATKKESQTRDGSTKPKVEKATKALNVEDLVSAIYQGVNTMKPIGQLTEKGLKEAKVIEAWIMQLQKNQAKAKVSA